MRERERTNFKGKEKFRVAIRGMGDGTIARIDAGECMGNLGRGPTSWKTSAISDIGADPARSRPSDSTSR